MSVGALLPSAKGEPINGEIMPVAEFTEKAEMVLSTLFTTKMKLPVGSTARPKGCCPVATSVIGASVPLLLLKDTNVPACTLVQKTNLSMGSIASRNGL